MLEKMDMLDWIVVGFILLFIVTKFFWLIVLIVGGWGYWKLRHADSQNR